MIILVSFLGSGSKAKIRQDYIKHHRIILLLLVVMWLPPIYTNFLIRLDRLDSPLFDLANKVSFFCMIALTGVITIVRIAFDKFLRQKVRIWVFRSKLCCPFAAKTTPTSITKAGVLPSPRKARSNQAISLRRRYGTCPFRVP